MFHCSAAQISLPTMWFPPGCFFPFLQHGKAMMCESTAVWTFLYNSCERYALLWALRCVASFFVAYFSLKYVSMPVVVSQQLFSISMHVTSIEPVLEYICLYTFGKGFLIGSSYPWYCHIFSVICLFVAWVRSMPLVAQSCTDHIVLHCSSNCKS